MVNKVNQAPSKAPLEIFRKVPSHFITNNMRKTMIAKIVKLSKRKNIPRSSKSSLKI